MTGRLGIGLETEDLIHQVKSSHHMLLLFKTGIYSRALTDEQLHLDTIQDGKDFLKATQHLVFA